MVEPHGLRGSFFRGNKYISTQSQNKTKQKQMSHFFYVALPCMMVSQFLVGQTWTLKCQNGVEFDFQLIWIHLSSLGCQNGGLLGLFQQVFILSKKKIFKFMSTCCFTVGGWLTTFCYSLDDCCTIFYFFYFVTSAQF